MAPLPEIAGTKVVLRPFEAQDITETYVGWLRDPEVTRFSNQRFREHTLQTCRSLSLIHI